MSAEFIKRERIEINFAQVPKTALKDPKLSLKAKGLYSYLFSLPEDWKVYKTEIVKHFLDGKDSMNGAFKELTENGYLISKTIKNTKTGKFQGTELELLINPLRVSRSGEPVNGEPASNNTDSSNNSFKNKRISKPNKFIKPSLNEVKDYFIENGYSEDGAKTAFKYYEAGDVDGQWFDASGKKVISWKQKMISTWFKPENKQVSVQNKISF